MTTFSTEIEVLSYSVLKYYIKGKLSDYFNKDIQVHESPFSDPEYFNYFDFHKYLMFFHVLLMYL